MPEQSKDDSGSTEPTPDATKQKRVVKELSPRVNLVRQPGYARAFYGGVASKQREQASNMDESHEDGAGQDDNTADPSSTAVQPRKRRINLPDQHVSVTGVTEDQLLAVIFQEMRSRPGQKRSSLWGPHHKGLEPLPDTKSPPEGAQDSTHDASATHDTQAPLSEASADASSPGHTANDKSETSEIEVVHKSGRRFIVKIPVPYTPLKFG